MERCLCRRGGPEAGVSRPEGVHPRQRTPVPVTSRRRDSLPDRQSCGQAAGGLLPVRKQGEDLSPRAGRSAQVRSVAAPGWQSVPADRGSADNERLPRSSLAAWTGTCPPEPWMTSLCKLAAAGAFPVRSRVGKREVQERGAFVPVRCVSWFQSAARAKDGQSRRAGPPALGRTGPERSS